MKWVAGTRAATVVGAMALSGVLAGSLLTGGCAFDDSAASKFTPEPSLPGASLGPSKPPPPPTSTTKPSGPCVDPDPAVVATCLDTAAGLVSLGEGALVAERRTGRILQVAPKQPPVEISRLPVDPAGDGGLSDIALSPTYGEDNLLYAYITTQSDNRIVRFAKGEAPKPILTGIPKGATGNRGAIDWSKNGDMLIVTGNAGNPGAANAPQSLAGKVLRLHDPAPNSPPPTVLASGIGAAGDICVGNDQVWVTDRTPTADRLQHLEPQGGANIAWTWPDRPGVGGCVVAPDGVAVALMGRKALAIAKTDTNTHAVNAAPSLTAQNRYGQLLGAAAGPDGTLWVSTANKSDGGQPGPFDDRVVRIPPSAASGGGPD